MRWCDAERLMKRRKAQGFTALQICALDPERDVGMCSPAGEPALTGGDLGSPNERYFEYLDRLLDMAENYGLYVLLLPVWGQLVVGDDWGGGKYEITVRADNAYEYGCWIGERYKERTNILWCLGGDRMPIHKGVDYREVWRRMAEGLAKGLSGKDLRHDEPSPVWERLLITYHACHEMETGKCSTFSYWDDREQWIRFIMLQSGHGTEVKNYELVQAEYQRKHRMPVWDGEPAYEMMPTAWPDGMEVPRHTADEVRRRAYWSLLSGAFGFTYGHASVWCSVYEGEENPMGPVTWQSALDSEGSKQMLYLRAFMEAMDGMAAKPCQEIILNDDQRSGDTARHAQAALTNAGKTICVYLPQGGSTELDLRTTWNRNCVRVWYWSPRDGDFSPEQAADEMIINNRLRITAPSEGPGQDWLTILTETSSGRPISQISVPEAEKQVQAEKVFDW